ESPFVQIVEKQPADAARFVAMLQIKIFVAPFFKARINIGAERHAGLAGCTVPVNAILLETVIGRQVVTAAEPPYGFCSRFLGDKETHIGVGGGYIRVVRVYDQ